MGSVIRDGAPDVRFSRSFYGGIEVLASGAIGVIRQIFSLTHLPLNDIFLTEFGKQFMARIKTDDIRKLSDFRANATAHLDRLAETGRIEVLTVNGEAKGVVMSPHVFDEMVEHIEELETAASIRRGLADAAASRTRPAREAIQALANELGLDLRTNEE